MNEFSQSYFIRLCSTLSLLLTLKFDHLICAPYWHLIVEQKTIEGSISDDAQGFKHNSNSLAGSCSFADRSQTSMGL
jgi:hypothetical protein